MTRAITWHSHWSWPSLTLDIAYYFNDVTLNIGCHGSHPISTMTWRVSEECQSGIWIRGCGVQRGLQVTFRGGGGLGVAFGGGVRQGVGVGGACGSVGNCWEELRMGSTPKRLWNWEAVRVWRMPKASEVRVGKTPRQLWSGKDLVPWQKMALLQPSRYWLYCHYSSDSIKFCSLYLHSSSNSHFITRWNSHYNPSYPQVAPIWKHPSYESSSIQIPVTPGLARVDY